MFLDFQVKDFDGITFMLGQDQETDIVEWRRKVIEDAPSTTIIAFDKNTEVKANSIVAFLKNGNEEIVCDLRCEYLDEDLEDVRIHPSKRILILRPCECTLYEYPDGSGGFSSDGAITRSSFAKHLFPQASVVFLLCTNMDADHIAQFGIGADHYLKLNETQPYWIGWS
jgi:hypothetical protein